MNWYEDEVRHLEKVNKTLKYRPETAFYGSSSIRLWTSLYEDFVAYKPVNLGFGGSTLAACAWFFERVFSSYSPSSIIVYAGDNDLGDGRTPEELLLFFQQLTVKIARRYGDLPCYFISIKPSISRWDIIDNLRYSNKLIEEEIHSHHKNWRYINVFNRMLDKTGHPDKVLFEDDGLHLSEEGYALWTQIVRSKLSRQE